MHTQKPMPGAAFPSIQVPQLGAGALDLGARSSSDHWKLVIVYLGRHCPICTRYLRKLNDMIQDLTSLRIDVAVVSADSKDRASEHMAQISPQFPVGYDLTITQMQQLGLYISGPRNGMDVEVPFAEPGLFVVDEAGAIKIADISNVAFARPEMQSLLGGLNFLRGMTGTFPINGTHA